MKGILVSHTDDQGHRQFAVEYHGYRYPTDPLDIILRKLKPGDLVEAKTFYDPESSQSQASIFHPERQISRKSIER